MFYDEEVQTNLNETAKNLQGIARKLVSPKLDVDGMIDLQHALKSIRKSLKIYIKMEQERIAEL